MEEFESWEKICEKVSLEEYLRIPEDATPEKRQFFINRSRNYIRYKLIKYSSTLDMQVISRHHKLLTPEEKYAIEQINSHISIVYSYLNALLRNFYNNNEAVGAEKPKFKKKNGRKKSV